MLALDRAAVWAGKVHNMETSRSLTFSGAGHAGEGSSHPLHENHRTSAFSGRRQQGHDGGRGLGRCIERAVDHGKESVVALANACLCGHQNEGRVGSASYATADVAKSGEKRNSLRARANCGGGQNGGSRRHQHTTRGRTATDRGTRAHATLSPGHVHVLSSPRPSVRSGMGRSACRGAKKAGQVGGATVWAARVLSRPANHSHRKLARARTRRAPTGGARGWWAMTRGEWGVRGANDPDAKTGRSACSL